MEEPDVNESPEGYVTEAVTNDDEVVSVDAEAVMEGASESVSEDAPAEAESPGARARAESEAERAQRLAEARHESEPAEVDESELVCETHGGELRQTAGKYRWICDRTQTPGSCVAGYRE